MGLKSLLKQPPKDSSPTSAAAAGKGSKLVGLSTKLSNIVKSKSKKCKDASECAAPDSSTSSTEASLRIPSSCAEQASQDDSARPSSVFVETRPALADNSGATQPSIGNGSTSGSWAHSSPCDTPAAPSPQGSEPLNTARTRRPRQSSSVYSEPRSSFSERPQECEERRSVDQSSCRSSLYSVGEMEEMPPDCGEGPGRLRSRRASSEAADNRQCSHPPASRRSSSRRSSGIYDRNSQAGSADADGTWDAVYKAKEMMASEWYSQAEKGAQPASEISDTHSWLSRSEHDITVETVLSSSLYSKQGTVPTMSKEQRTQSASDDSHTTFPWATDDSSALLAPRGCRSAELVREIKQSKLANPSPEPAPPLPPQGYVDELTLEEEAFAIVSPSTCLAISSDGIKYRTLAGTKGTVDAHAPVRAQAANAQLARLAFNLPSVRDAEHQRCRNELRLSAATSAVEQSADQPPDQPPGDQ